MNQPCAVLQLCERVVVQAVLNVLFDLVDFFHSGIPVHGENLAGKFPPVSLALFVVVCGLRLLVLPHLLCHSNYRRKK